MYKYTYMNVLNIKIYYCNHYIGSFEVKNILNNLNNNSASGVDGYTALFFKQIGTHH